MKTGVCLLILAAVFPPVAKAKKPAGEIPDPTVFAAVRSYCVDASGLPENEAYEVNGFLKEESKPGRLLSKIPWKLIPTAARRVLKPSSSCNFRA